MALTRADIVCILEGILHEELGVEHEDVVPTARLREDLTADSLDRVHLVMAIEESFGLDIHDADAESMVTVGDVIDYVCLRLQVAA